MFNLTPASLQKRPTQYFWQFLWTKSSFCTGTTIFQIINDTWLSQGLLTMKSHQRKEHVKYSCCLAPGYWAPPNLLSHLSLSPPKQRVLLHVRLIVLKCCVGTLNFSLVYKSCKEKIKKILRTLKMLMKGVKVGVGERKEELCKSFL